MINSAALHSDLSRLRRETTMLLATVETLSADELAAPSLCGGWSRAEVVAHLAANGRALGRLVDLAATGEERRLYASPGARNTEIAELAALPRVELLAALRAAADGFAVQAERLTGPLALQEVALHARPIAAPFIVALRIAEVVIHHHDLATAWTVEEADPDSQLDAVEAAVFAMRAKGAPGMTLVTEEGDEWVIGDGALRVESDRGGMIAWLARGQGRHVEADGELPVLPAW